MPRGEGAIRCLASSNPSSRLSEKASLKRPRRPKTSTSDANSLPSGHTKAKPWPDSELSNSDVSYSSRNTESGKSTQDNCWLTSLLSTRKTTPEDYFKVGLSHTWPSETKESKKSSKRLSSRRFRASVPTTARRLRCSESV